MTRIGVPAIFVVLLGLIAVVFLNEDAAKVFSTQPLEPYDSFARSFATGIEINVGLGFSWLAYFSAASRLSKTENVAYQGAFWGYGVLLNIAAIVGAFTALLVGSTDPTDWLIALGGAFGGFIGLILLILANVTSTVVLMYAQSLAFKTLFPQIKWITALSTSLPATVLLFFPAFYSMYDTFLSIVSFVIGIFGGIIVTDFLLVKKQQISVRDLYDKKGCYTYWKGINPSALVAFIVGTVFYWTLYNPLTDSASPLFSYITAGIPTFFLTAIVHYICSRYVFTMYLDLQNNQSVSGETF